ncbi:MAG: PTS transporter subunit EIIB [Bulleidia sp.]
MPENSNTGPAEEIMKLAGGKENLTSATHRITRLRFTLKDRFKAETAGFICCGLSAGLLPLSSR